jgi:hypothetical protein
LLYNNWNPGFEATLLGQVMSMRKDAGQLSQAQKCQQRLLQLVEKTGTHLESVDFDCIRTAITEGQFATAAHVCTGAKKALRSDRFNALRFNILGFQRAYPLMSKQHLHNAISNNFPDELFQSTPSVVASNEPGDPGKYLKTVLWLAQYEYCRGNLPKAETLCNEIINAKPATISEAYVPATDMLAEMQGKRNEKIVSGSSLIKARRGTVEELHCLWSIYVQMGKPAAAERVKALKNRIREVNTPLESLPQTSKSVS